MHCKHNPMSSDNKRTFFFSALKRIGFTGLSSSWHQSRKWYSLGGEYLVMCHLHHGCQIWTENINDVTISQQHLMLDQRCHLQALHVKMTNTLMGDLILINYLLKSDMLTLRGSQAGATLHIPWFMCTSTKFKMYLITW